MNLEPVCVESPRLVPSPPSSHGELKRKAACDNDCRGDAGRSASDAALKQILIEIALEKIAAHGLFGREHVLQYLMDLYRRNCRPNTLRSRFASIFVFLQYLKAQGRQLLEQVGREDVCAFIEQEQDRGLKTGFRLLSPRRSVCLHRVFSGSGSPQPRSTQTQAARQGSRQPAAGHRSAATCGGCSRGSNGPGTGRWC